MEKTIDSTKLDDVLKNSEELLVGELSGSSTFDDIHGEEDKN